MKTGPERLEVLFSEAVELAPAERSAFLAAACGEDRELRTSLERLLALDAADGGPVDEPVVLALEARVAPPPDARALPATIGRYRIDARLGEGAMGVVYEATQPNPERRVALKVLRRGAASEDAERRFALEAQLLARLEHPCIAQIFEAGHADIDGQSAQFFAMERVVGVDVRSFVQKYELGMNARLELVAQICDAVQHAHQKGVLHRDLKPGNILVTEEGRPKVLDFGIGRLVEDEGWSEQPEATLPGTLMGTLAYMSPEQASGFAHRVDTRTDVYALGAILFELLCGELPIPVAGCAIAEALRKIEATDPRDLRAVDPKIDVDIATIAAKALEKDPERRYASAEALASDLRRYLRSEPISARPATAAYRVRRFIARNRGLAAGVALAVLALLVGTGLAVQWALRADRSAADALAAKATARIEAENNASVVRFVERMFSAALTDVADGEEMSARQLVDAGRASLHGRFGPDSWSGARIRSFLARAVVAVGDYEDAGEMLAEALPTLEKVYGASHPRVLLATADLAKALSRKADAQPAVDLFEDVLRRVREAGLGACEAAARSHYGLGQLARVREDFASAETHYRAVIGMLDSLPDMTDTGTAQAWADLASVLTETGRLDEASEHLEKATTLAGESASPVVRSRLETQRGLLSFRQKNADTALACFERALRFGEAALDEKHPMLVRLLQNLASVKGSAGDPKAAENLLKRAIGICRVAQGVPPEAEAQVYQNFGNCRAAANDVDGAMTNWEHALEIQRKLVGPDSLAAASLYKAMAWGHAQRGDEVKARRWSARADRIRAASAAKQAARGSRK